MYFGYEVAHRRTHTHPPRNRYGRWARRSHLHHHFGAPMQNFGVTTPLWDRLWRTHDQPGLVTVPRRMAPAWLLDEAGEMKAEFADDYVVKGASPLEATAERDWVDAFANVAPEVELAAERSGGGPRCPSMPRTRARPRRLRSRSRR